MKFDIITIFPGIFEGFSEQSLLARAQKKGLLSIMAHDLRAYTDDLHQKVDDTPYGGGVGMVMKVEPIMKAVADLKQQNPGPTSRVILFSPRGKKFTQKKALEWAELDQLILICGRYEGIDERVHKYIADEVISIGDYVLFGGEVPAMAVIESVARQIPEVIAKEESASKDDHAQYTRPEVIEILGTDGQLKKRKVPAVLRSGDHKKIGEWREKHS